MTAIVTPLQKARKKRRLSQDDVADSLGITQAYYSRVERAKGVSASAELAARLARFFKREGIEEQHVLYPRRFRSFEPA